MKKGKPGKKCINCDTIAQYGYKECSYHRYLRHKGLPPDRPRIWIRKNKGFTCTISLCLKPAFARAMCHRHWFRWYRGKRGSELAAPIKQRRRNTRRYSSLSILEKSAKLLDKYCERRGLTHHMAIDEIINRYFTPNQEHGMGMPLSEIAWERTREIAWQRELDEAIPE